MDSQHPDPVTEAYTVKWANNCVNAAGLGQQWLDELFGLLTTPLRKYAIDSGFAEMPTTMMIVKAELGDAVTEMLSGHADYDRLTKEYAQAATAMRATTGAVQAFWVALGSPTPQRLQRWPGGVKFWEIMRGTAQLQGWVDELGVLIEAVWGGEPIDPPVDPGEPSGVIWNTQIPEGLPAGAQEATHRMNWGEGTWYPGKTEPELLPTSDPKLTGVWYGFQGQTSWGESGTLWYANAYNIYGVLDGLEIWGIGDFAKGREGHGLYFRCVPNLDTTIRNYKCYKNGGQAIQREWRMHETDIPQSEWGEGGGTFLVEDCDFQETGLIDEGTGGSAVRASWALSLYNTMQHTIVRRVQHINYYSPAPHEGSLFVGFGQNAWRTPSLLVEDSLFYTLSPDRADIFLQGVDAGTVRTTALPGLNPRIDVVNNCGAITIQEMPQDVMVNTKPGSNPHGAPIAQQLLPAGQSMTLTF